MPLLQALLLLYVFLLQLLRLLLVLLLSLLFCLLVRILLRKLLVLFVLLLLKLLPFLILLLLKLLLLLLIFLVKVGIPRVGSCRPLHRRKVVRMNCRGGGSGRVTAVLSSWCSRSAIGRRIVWCSGFSRRHDIVSSELSRLGGSGDRRLAVIRRGAKFRIAPRSLYVLRLSGRGREMLIMCCSFLFRSWTGSDSTFSAVVADSIYVGSVVDDGCVVDIVNVGNVHIRHRAVVEKVSAVPASTYETVPEVSETVVNTAIETDMRTPIAVIENKRAVGPTPIRRSPEKSNFRS